MANKMTDREIRTELARLTELQAVLMEKRGQQDGVKALAEAQPMIRPGSDKHAALLSTGYGMDKKKAQTIIKEYKADPTRWPYEMLEKAEAFMENLTAKPVVISTRPPWQIRARVIAGGAT